MMLKSQHIIALYKHAPASHFTGRTTGLASEDFLISPHCCQIYPEFLPMLAFLLPQFAKKQS